MPNIFKRFTRHVLIVPGQNAAANLIQRWLCNRMVSRNLVRTLHTTRKGRNFSMTRSLHGRLFTYTFFTRRIFTTTRSFHGWKILCKTYTIAIFWFHCVTKGRPKNYEVTLARFWGFFLGGKTFFPLFIWLRIVIAPFFKSKKVLVPFFSQKN